MDNGHYYQNRKRRFVGQSLVALQGFRYLGFALYLLWMAGVFTGWEPLSRVAVPALNLTAFALAVGVYWAAGAWYESEYGRTGRSLLRDFRGLIMWAVALGMMCSVLVGSDGLMALLFSAAFTCLGALVVLWIVVKEIFGRRQYPHWLAVFLIIQSAALMIRASSSSEHYAVVVTFGFMGLGLLAGCTFDHFRLVRNLEPVPGSWQ